MVWIIVVKNGENMPKLSWNFRKRWRWSMQMRVSFDIQYAWGRWHLTIWISSKMIYGLSWLEKRLLFIRTTSASFFSLFPSCKGENLPRWTCCELLMWSSYSMRFKSICNNNLIDSRFYSFILSTILADL